MRLFCGIDPGAVSGAWGMIDHNGKYWSSGHIPNDGGRIRAKHFKAELLQAVDKQDISYIIENVHSMPQQGVASTFKFARAVGAIEAVIDLIGPWWIVTPQRWKKDMELSSSKVQSLNMARQMWPDAPLVRVKDHGVAEALLLAEWLRRQNL